MRLTSEKDIQEFNVEVEVVVQMCHFCKKPIRKMLRKIRGRFSIFRLCYIFAYVFHMQHKNNSKNNLSTSYL